MRVLVTGAKGFLGREIVAELLSQGHEVLELTRRTSQHERDVRGDVTDLQSLIRALKGCDAIVHAAGRLADEKDSYEVNVEGAKHLVEAAKQNGVQHIVYISTASVKIAKKGTYASTKHQAENVFRQSGITTTILRPSIVYGSAMRGVFGAVANATKLPFVPVFGDGSWLSAPIRVEDVARAVRVALEDEKVQGNTYDVGGPESISFDDLVHEIGGIYNLSPHIVHIPSWIGLFAARILSFVQKPPITRSNILGSTQQIEWDREIFFRDFGFTPLLLSEGLSHLKEFEKERARAREADILFRYVFSRSGVIFKPSNSLRERYKPKVSLGSMHPLLVSFPFLIGSLDAGTKFLKRSCGLRSRLQLALVLVETDPQSAAWLLPQQRSIASVLWQSVLLSCTAALKLVVGIPLVLLPSAQQTYVR